MYKQLYETVNNDLMMFLIIKVYSTYNVIVIDMNELPKEFLNNFLMLI